MSGLDIAAQPLRNPAGEVVLTLPALSLAAGERWAVLGPNGAGKSTFLRHCAGHDPRRHDSGTASAWQWQGRPLPLWHDAGWARVRAFLPQQHQLSAPLSVHALLRMAAFPWGGAHARLADALEDAVRHWDLAGLLPRPWLSLSGGEQQRAQLARSQLQLMLAEPGDATLWLLDEPLAALDWRHQQTVLAACREQAARNSLVLASVHDMNAALAIATHVLVLGQGEVLMAGEMHQERFREALQEAFSVRLGWVSHPDDGRPWLVPLAG